MSLTSHILIGQVMHQRHRPRWHRFVYPVFYLRVNLNELSALNSPVFGYNRWRPFSLYGKDYGARDGSDLLVWLRTLLAGQGMNLDGAVLLQTMPRIFGFAFNPISLWYCYDSASKLRAVLAEVNNTFGDHHFYLLRAENEGEIANDSTLRCEKLMHVSPFCEVKGSYRFRFRQHAHGSSVNIDYFDDSQNEVLLETAIACRRLDWSVPNLWRTLWRQPLLTLGVVWRIHWQALLLWRKRVPFFREPPKQTGQAAEYPAGYRLSIGKEQAK